ncbi:hypothetical protein CU098_003676, partial [Rhizopus stolonifer]
MRIITSAILFLLISSSQVSSLPTKTIAPIHLPLRYVKRVHPQSLQLLQHVKRDISIGLSASSNDTLVAAVSNSGTDISIPLINDADLSELAVQVNIGTPSQPFFLLFDTGSADTWVPSTQCGSNDGCPSFLQRFDTKGSSTYQALNDDLHITYGIGSASGTYFNDSFSFEGTSASLSQQRLAIVNKAAGPISTQNNETDVDQVLLDGIFGAGFPAGTTSAFHHGQTYNPPIFNLYKQGLIPQPVFTVTIHDQDGGHVVLGDADTSAAKTQQLVYANVPRIQNSFTHWSVSLKGLQFQNASASTNFHFNQNTIFGVDTGSNFMYLPKILARGLADVVSNHTFTMDTKTKNVFVVDCAYQDTDNQVNFYFDNAQSITIPVKHLIAKRASDGQCLLLFVASENNFILGNMFLRHFVT